jgi:hypothetical protein
MLAFGVLSAGGMGVERHALEQPPQRPLRQWVLSLPHAPRFLLASDPDALTLVQRFGSS